MKTDETTYDDRIALQPETALEQEILAQTFVRLKQVTDAPGHPEYVGNELVFYTVDLDEYDDLSHDLFEEAEIDVNAKGKLDPEPGSRALVVAHSRQPQPERGDAPTEDEIEAAVESLAEGNDGEDNEFTRDAFEVAKAIRAAEPLEEAEDEAIWEFAADVNTTGILHIDVEKQDEEATIDDLREFVDVVDETIRGEIESGDEEGDEEDE